MPLKQKGESILRIINLMSENKTGTKISFSCSKTEEVSSATGDGTLVPIFFEECNENVKDGVFTAPQSGTYFVNWKIFLQNITTQAEAIVQVQSSNKIFSFPTNNLSALKDNGHIVLTGTALVAMDITDTVRLIVKVGASKDSKTVDLSASSDAQFSGFLT